MTIAQGQGKKMVDIFCITTPREWISRAHEDAMYEEKSHIFRGF